MDERHDERKEDYFHEKSGEVARYLALPALGVTWLFKVNVDNRIVFPRLLGMAMCLIVAGLLIDLVYYLLGTTDWGWPRLRAWFWVKMANFVAGYMLLLYFLSQNTFILRQW